jgi:hypothetical protein
MASNTDKATDMIDLESAVTAEVAKIRTAAVTLTKLVPLDDRPVLSDGDIGRATLVMADDNSSYDSFETML